jgi:hypothetical protein
VTAIPAGRGRWRVTLHRRAFTTTTTNTWRQTLIAELTAARSRQLVQQLNTPASFQFTIDGEDPQASLPTELATEIRAWRWNDAAGADVCMFRGVIDHSEDQITEQAAVVTFVAHDMFAMLSRRFTTQTLTFSQTNQDSIVAALLGVGNNPPQSAPPAGTYPFYPGSELQVVWSGCNPDGSQRVGNVQPRDRVYPAQTQIDTAIDQLAHVINGYDYDVQPIEAFRDQLRVFYPQQGVERDDVVLAYGSTVADITRTVASSDYANYVRVLGNNGSSDPAAAQMFAEAWNADANDVGRTQVGLWMLGENAADVSIQATLNDQAAGALNYYGVLVPSYTLTLAPHAYRYGSPNMGDTCPLIIRKGRLNVDTLQRVVGITYAIGDDGEEDVQLTVGRPPTLLADRLTKAARDIDALARR